MVATRAGARWWHDAGMTGDDRPALVFHPRVTLQPDGGRYLAHGYARMLAIYGPNPSGEPSSQFRSWRLDGTA